MDVEDVPDQIGYHWRARTALWQSALVTCDLRYKRRRIGMQGKTAIAHEVSTNAAEVDGWEEFL